MDADRWAWGYGLATITSTDDEQPNVVLDTWYPAPALGKGPDDDPYGEPADLAAQAKEYPRRGVRTQVVHTSIDLDAPPANASDAYLRLHLLSCRLAEPNSLNLDGIFGVLANVVWTSLGPCAVEGFEARRLRMRDFAPVQVFGVDKFPRMSDYVVPSGVRVADASCVRLGAYLAAGSTVMPSGFVNFNAGTLGGAMVEGRISQGVVVGEGSDIGGGASIMGTMSGGGTHRVAVGQRCLVGAQAGIGISLGDDCVVEAGLYLTAGTKVRLLNSAVEGDGTGTGTLDSDAARVVKAADLSGRNGLLYWRNSLSGSVEARPRAGSGATLNSVLHAQ